MNWPFWKILIFVWLSFSMVKVVIVFGTFIKIALERKRPIFPFILGGLIPSIGAILICPWLLYDQKLKFFEFPDDVLYRTFMDFNKDTKKTRKL